MNTSFNKITNPETGRKVSIYGKIGTKVLRNYLQQMGGHQGPCAINPTSGRCKKSKVSDGKCTISSKGCCRKLTHQEYVAKGAREADVTPEEFQNYLDVIADPSNSPFDFGDLPPL